jgi:phage tail-like protein
MPEEDIYRAYNFKLDIQGVAAGYFTEVSGLNVKVEAIEYREGGAAPGVRRLPGRVSVGAVTLRYGLTSSTYLWDWLMTAVQGKVERKNVSIILVGTDGVTELTRWNLTNVWVSEWRGAMLDAIGQKAAIESVTLMPETLERAPSVKQPQEGAAA